VMSVNFEIHNVGKDICWRLGYLDWDGWVKIGICLWQTKPKFSFRLLSWKHLEIFLYCAELFLATVMPKHFNTIPSLTI
jgi:hypothetical protein